MVRIKSIITAFLVVTTVIFAADDTPNASGEHAPAVTTVQGVPPEAGRWIAVNPYADQTYVIEHVSFFAKAVNYTATLAVMGGLTAMGVVVLYYGSDTLGYEGIQTAINAAESLDKPLSYMIILDPTHVLATSAYLASFPFINFPSGVFTAYTTKKAAQVTEEFAHQGWKIFRYGLDKATYVWDHLRAQHLQGTIFANRHATYVEAADDSTTTSTSSASGH